MTSDTIAIRGAVLHELGATSPYVTSRPITVEDLILDTPGPGEILVRIEAASICHSDLSVVNGSRPRPVPMLLGHEAAGTVEALGEGVTDLRLGQRVIATFLPRCGTCRECGTNGKLPCSAGSATNGAGTLMSGATRLHRHDGTPVAHHLGVSGFATAAVMDRRSVVPVEDDVPPEIAAVLGCAVLTGAGALLNAAPSDTAERIAVVGLGGVGMAGLLAAIGQAPGEVIAIDQHEGKLELAREWGADVALTPAQAVAEGVTADVVLEAVGHPRAFETAHHVTGTGGTLVTVGLPAPGATAAIEPLQLTAKAQTVVGSYLGSSVPSRDIPVFADRWRDGTLPLDRLISTELPLDDINEGMDALSDGSVLRQILRVDA